MSIFQLFLIARKLEDLDLNWLIRGKAINRPYASTLTPSLVNEGNYAPTAKEIEQQEEILTLLKENRQLRIENDRYKSEKNE